MSRLPACLAVGLLLSAAPAFAQNVSAPAKAKATTPEIPFDSVPNFLKLPAGLYMGEGTGVATNSKGHVGKAGKLPKEFGIVNALDCRTENDLVVGEIWNWRAQKVTLKR